MDTLQFLLTFLLAFAGIAQAQQYLGDFINNSLPLVPNTEITYFRIPDPAGKNNNLTLINYYSHDTNDKRITESKIQRAVIVVHGLNRDPGTYESNAMSALFQLNDPNINFDTVAVIAPYFANGDDKNVGYPWTAGLPAGQGSTTNALVWPGSQWSAGGNAQYPAASAKTISSFYVLDTLIKYFDNQALFPNVKQIVVAGHSLGAQTVHRYALIGNNLNTKSPVTYWVANPNSYTWPATTRPFDTSTCAAYDNYRDGFNNFTQYPMTYATSLVAQGRPAIVTNYQSKGIAFARGLQDLGDDSSNCAPFTTGSNRNERFFNFIKAFPPTCPDPKARSCDTIDLINVGHDSGQMMASPAGQRRLFLDNFKGDGSRGVDMGYPRVQAGDDPFPDPTLNGTLANYNNNTYAGNMTYFGCYSDQQPPTLLTLAYDNSNNTIELCTATCNSMGYSIAGVEYASQCYCGNALTSKAQRTVESSCGFACAANANETCGGFGRISIFSKGKPAQLSPPVAPETVGPYYYQNCVIEVPGRALQADALYSTNNMTLENCAKYCSAYRYFGTEYAQECYCGNSIAPGANATANSDCNMVCSGNPLELCGAGNRITLYGLPPGVQPSVVSSAAPPAPTGASITCPQSNNTIYSTSGQNFLIECGIDHLGGDLSSVNVDSFSQCIDVCAKTAGCVDVSLSGAACYMKSQILEAQPNAGIYGAKFVGNTTVSSTVTTKSSTVLSSSSSSTSSVAVVTSSSTSSPVVVTSSSTSSVVVVTSSSTSSPVVVTSSSTSSVVVVTSSSTSSSVVVTSSSSSVVSTSSSVVVTSSTTTSSSVPVITSSSSVIVTSTTSSTSSSTPPPVITSSTVTSSSSAPPAASATPVTCPASNNTVFTAFNGARFLIECGINHYAGDLSMTYVADMNACINTCANTTSCVDVTMNGNACYLKSVLGDAQTQGGVLGAKLLPPATPTSSSTSSKPTTTTYYTAVSGYAYPTLAPGFQYNGCFQDGGARVFPVFNGSTSTNTPQSCANNCRALGYKYSGTEYASECYCANYLSAPQVSDSQCAKPCAGDATQNCGDGYRLSVVIDNNWKQTLFARQSYNTWTLSGCYVDNANGRDLPNPIALPGGPNSNTIASCLSACQAQGYTYCGAEYYKECYGANAIGGTNTPLAGNDIIAAGCDTPCSGNATEVCGGTGKIAIYVNKGTSA